MKRSFIMLAGVVCMVLVHTGFALAERTANSKETENREYREGNLRNKEENNNKNNKENSIERTENRENRERNLGSKEENNKKNSKENSIERTENRKEDEPEVETEEAEELCVDGRLLFREDFGGNEQSDPAASTTPVSGMSSGYRQVTNLETKGNTQDMSAGRYLVAKRGYRNSTNSNYSCWHIMDDHTHWGDTTRGYLLEIDGKGGSNDVFYSTLIENLRPKSHITFSAYVANLTTAGQYLGWISRGYVHPKLLFVISEPETGVILAQQSTDTISHDWGVSTIDGSARKKWQESAEWQLQGMNFVVPEGVHSARLSIRNNAGSSATGNDFALDDIEIWQCTPKVQIVSPESVCEDAPYSFEIEIVNAHLFEGELSYKWMYRSPDNPNGWQEMAGGNVREPRIDAFKARNAGWYKVYVAEEGKIDDPNERVESEEFYVSLMKCGDELCTDGVLLFREDFGGNEESDPVAGTDPVEGMSSSYEQIYDTAHCHGRSGCRGMGSGRYLLTKTGYRNAESYTWSHWYIMDDHTYPNDYNRGYLLEIDGKGGSDAFFKKRMDGLCSGSKLSFTAYVANVTTGASYLQNRHSYTYPRLSFIITDPRDGSILARHNTDTIGHDWQFYNQPGAWRNSAEWQLVGMNFTVPEGVEEAELSIINNNDGWTGNDFALDDIEIRLCTPAVEITAPDSVCIDTKMTLRAVYENNDVFVKPLQFKWLFSTDSLNWEDVDNSNTANLQLKAKPKHSGWYRVAVAGAGGLDSENCRSLSEPFKLHVIEECPPILCPEGVLLKHDEVGGTVTNWSGEIADLCPGTDLSFIVNLPSPHEPTRLMIRITESESGNELRAYDTGDIPSDSLQVGTTFTVPEGVNGIQWSIRQNGGIGGFLIENTEVRLCIEPIRITSNSPACRKKRHVFRGVYENYGTLASPEFRWEFSTDSATWTTLQEGATQNYTIPIVHKSHEGWYRVSVSEAGNLDKPNCREASEPFKLETKYCETAVEQHFDTIVCDTLLASGYAWRGHIWNTSGNEVDTLKDIDGDDSVYVHKTLETKVCCPDILNFRVDTAVCDTLMPFVWLWRDRMLVFEEIGEQEVEIAHAKWESCVGEVYTLHLDTFHCERLYPIIVNKYNWLVLLDYRALRRFFPEQTAVAFQWYKDSVAIEGGTEDDYSETQELHGHFQLRVRMNDGLYVWSNILDISDTPESQPIHVRVYNSNGILLYEEDIQGDGYTPVLPAGIYFLRYERGDEVWTEKRVTQ